MPQSLVQIYVHIVFSMKHRRPFLKDKEFRERTHRYLAGICKNLNSPALIVGGVEDHIHILCRLGKTIDIAELIRDLKRDSSKWVKAEQPRLAEFHWQQSRHVSALGERTDLNSSGLPSQTCSSRCPSVPLREDREGGPGRSQSRACLAC